MKQSKITVAGRVDDPHFHRCVTIANKVEESNPGLVQVEVHQFFETQWEEFLYKTAQRLKGVFYEHKASPLVLLDDTEYIGDQDAFAEYVLHTYRFKDENSSRHYESVARSTYAKAINESKTCKYVCMTFSDVASQSPANYEVRFELFHSIAPKTCENFLALCRGFKKADCDIISYNGTQISRVVKGQFI